MALNDPADPLVLNLDDVDAPDVDFYASLQDNLRTFREDFAILYQAFWGQEATNFLLSGTGIHQMDATWQPVRLLGQGGFGQVGLWERANDQTGEIEDEVAIKEMVRTAHTDVYLQRNPSLPREAVIMQQLNGVEERTNQGTNNNILRLRSFKNFPSARRSRFYLEYAPYGDLYKLMYSYRAWDTYLPEEFLWHVFCSFANAAVLMETGPFTHLEDQEPIQWSIIHLDIKPDNIFLGRRDERVRPADFPTIKVADFGLADLTGQDDYNNPAVFRGKGTPGYKPPEQTHFTIDWQRRPDGIAHLPTLPRNERERIENLLMDPGYKFLSGHNVWAFGKLMYDLMTLSWADDLDGKMNRETTEEEYYHSLHEHAIREITTGKDPDYSPALRQLIRECLHIEIGKRPTALELLTRTTTGFSEALTFRRLRTGRAESPRVYYMGHEINHMPRGNARLPMLRRDFRSFRKGGRPDPDWQPLLSARWAPEVRNGELVDQPIVEGGPQRDLSFNTAIVTRDLLRHGGVRWQLRSQPVDGVRQEDEWDSDDGDPSDEEQYERDSLYQLGLRRSGSHDTRSLSSTANRRDAASRRDTLRLARERANQDQAHLATSWAYHPPGSPKRPTPEPLSPQRSSAKRPSQQHHPPPPPPPPPPRIRLKPPKSPQEQPRKAPRRKKRALGLSIDGTFQEAEGDVVQGHNLRKRRR